MSTIPSKEAMFQAQKRVGWSNNIINIISLKGSVNLSDSDFIFTTPIVIFYVIIHDNKLRAMPLWYCTACLLVSPCFNVCIYTIELFSFCLLKSIEEIEVLTRQNDK